MHSYYKEDAWWVSRFNEEADVLARTGIAHPIALHDATLRDGEQTPGVVFSPDEKVEIARGLMAVGVERIEAGMPAVSPDDFQAMARICKLERKAKVFAFSRAMKKDIDMALDCGADGIVLEVPIGEPKLKYQFGWTWRDVLDKSVSSIAYAKAQGLLVTYFPYDTTRATQDDLTALLEGVCSQARPDSIGLVDTMGCAMPETIAWMVRWMHALTGVAVEVHTHNDFGMAVAGEIAGLCAGASVAHACVNGMGERTGNAALEELIMTLSILQGVPNPYQFEPLMALCQTVARISGIPFAQNKPFSGERNYCRESGIGIDQVMKNPLVMFATDPAYFGRKPSVVLGKKSGRMSIEYMLSTLGLEANEEQVGEMLARVKALSVQEKRLVTDDEFRQIAQACMREV